MAHNSNMPAKVLIIRLSSLGDIILTTPVIRCLKTQSAAEVHFLTRKQNAFLVADNPHIDKVVAVEKDPFEAVAFLKKQRYDLIVDLHNNLRSRRLTLWLHRPSERFPKLNIKKWLLVNLKMDLMPRKHIVDRYFEAVAHLGITNDGQGLDYFLNPKSIEDGKKITEQFPDGFDVLVAGARHFTKQIPFATALKLIGVTSRPCLILGGTEDSSKGEAIEADARGKAVNLCGKVSFNVAAYLVSQANNIITSDTGLMHVAAAYRKRTVVVWGNTVPGLGMYPYMPGLEHLYLAVENNHLACRPCSKIGFERCPKKHFKCMLDLDLSQAIEWLQIR